MSGPMHSAEVLAAFQNGEERMVYARKKGARPGAPFFFMEDGRARDPEFRTWTRANLECLFPECASPALTVVNRSEGSQRRDGFRHLAGASKHSVETLFHLQGKALIKDWVTRDYPEVIVAVESGTGLSDRVADVLLTWPDGRRVAVEIQYAPLTAASWLKRQESYLHQGVTPVWLLGHTGVHMRPAPAPAVCSPDRGDKQVLWTALHRAMTEHEAQVLWLNPIERAVGSPWTMARGPSRALWHATACSSSTKAAFVDVAPLDGCALDPENGLTTPGMSRLADAVQEHEQVEIQPWGGEVISCREPGPEFAGWDAQAERQETAQPARPPAWQKPETAACPDSDRTKCLACGLPLPPWQRGGVHILGGCRGDESVALSSTSSDGWRGGGWVPPRQNSPSETRPEPNEEPTTLF